MLCAISGEIPKEAVVSKSTGLIYERRLIEKSINDYQKCPVTGMPLSYEDLIEIKGSTKASQTKLINTNVTAVIDNLQTGYDDLLLETLTLRQQLDVTRKELAQSLYQHDAACRVIARLMKERDEARMLLQHFSTNSHHLPQQPITTEAVNDSNMDVSDKVDAIGKEEETGITEAIITELNTINKQLTTSRKQRKVPDSLLPKDKMQSTAEQRKLNVNGNAKITAIDIAHLHDSEQDFVAAANETGFVFFLDVKTSKPKFDTTKAHDDKVNALQFLPGSSKKFLSGGSDGAVKLWSLDRDNTFVNTFNYSKRDEEVLSLTLHPTSKYAVAATSQGSWRFLDLTAGVNCKTVKAGDVALSACKLHVDGLVLGTGNANGAFTIWDMREQKQVTELKDHTQAVTSIDFSENGYLCVTGSKDGLVKVWDLRKLSCLRTLDNGFNSVECVRFDHSGVYIGSVGQGKAGNVGRAAVTIVKEYTSPFTADADSALTSFVWGENAEYFLAAAADSTVRVFGQRGK